MTSPTAGSSHDVAKDPLYGWVMVGVVFTISALAFGTLGSVSVFLKPLAAEFGWGRGETALGYTAISFSSAVFGVLWGVLADKYGTRWFGVVSALVMTLALYLMSRQQTIVEFYAFYFLFGAFGTSMATTPLYANVAFWFRRNPGLALGLAASGGAFGQAVVPYLAGLGVDSVGWRATYLWMAVGYLCIALPCGFFVRESPWRLQAGETAQSEQRTFPLSAVEAVAWISVAVIFCCNCMAVPIVHLVPLLTDAGHTTEYAARALLILMLAGCAGRIMGGKLCDIIGALPAYMVMSLGQTVAVFWFPQVQGTAALYSLAIFFGFFYSGVMSSIMVCTRMMVGGEYAGRAMSVTSFFGWIGMGMGGFLGGYLFDLTTDYAWSYAFAGIAGVINLFILSLFWLRARHKDRQLMVT
ncbi:MAG: MFS transporter [Pseudomonadota bacterium]